MVYKSDSVIQKPKVDLYKPVEKTTQSSQNNLQNPVNNSASAKNEFRSKGEMLAFSLNQKFLKNAGHTVGAAVGQMLAFLDQESTAQTQGLYEPYNPDNIREDVVQRYVEYALIYGASNTALSSLQNPDLTRDEKLAILERIVNSEDAYQAQGALTLLAGMISIEDGQSQIDSTASTIAYWMNEAYEAGVVSEADLGRFVEQIGAEGAEELIATLSNSYSGTRHGGIVEALGRQAQGLGYERAAALAFTSSTELILRNLPNTPEASARAFELVNSYLQERDDFSEIDQFGEPSPSETNRLNIAANNIGNLLVMRGDTLYDSLLNTSPDSEGQADLVELFQKTLYSPLVGDEARNQILSSIDQYVGNKIRLADGSENSALGRDVGELFGTLQFASQRAIENARTPEEASAVRGYAVTALSTIASTTVGLLITGGNPILTALGTTAVSTIVSEVFGAESPNPDDLEDAFIESLQAAGGSTNLGEGMIDKINELQDALLAELNTRIENSTNPAETQELENARAEVEQFLGSINDGFQNTILSGSGGELREELNSRD